MKLHRDEMPPWPATISPEKVCFFILKAREFDVKDVYTDEGSASNPLDDSMIAVLEDGPDDPIQEELRSSLWALSEDEQIDLVTLVWLGRGDGGALEWDEIRTRAIDARNGRTAAYLLGTPLLPDYLEEALAMFGQFCDAFVDHL
ncbi:DUF3775 domain-containing protein [Rhizobium sp. IBUN]|uniref:DUF3775 domain-containing protein n=1 Tax=Rhizobium sp. IBUN TaxID=1042326 RepID=UPI0003FD82C9|nr:DUF3775 domain-containing protein [Rhizobium sp. IBUN]